jgi:hypothetical protein
VQLFKNAILTFPSPRKPARTIGKRAARKTKAKKSARSKKRKSRK